MAREREERNRVLRRVREAFANMRLPAALEDTGRDRNLVHNRDAHPSGARADSRHSVPGTAIPGGTASAPAADARTERVDEALGDGPAEDAAGDEPRRD